MEKHPIIFSLFLLSSIILFSCAASKKKANNVENTSAKTEHNDSTQIGLEHSVEEKLLKKYKKK